MKTYGRTVIYANYTEEQLLSGNYEQKLNKVIDILQNSVWIHEQNKQEIKYLQAYLYGNQDIKDKVKLTRTDINNKQVENWAYAMKEWKTTFLVGKPIQYAPLNDIGTNEITLLNNYNTYENKQHKDLDIDEDIFTVGRGFRYVNGSKITEEDETPYNLINLDVADTEIVYSSSIEHEQLLSYIQTSKKYIVQQINPETNKKEFVDKYYDEYTTYTRNMQYVITNKDGDWKCIKTTPILCNEHIITEYYKNRFRMSDLELVKDIFNDLNYIENLDLDDIEGFVNSIMVFTNAEVNREGMESIKQYGAVSIKSTDQKQAKIEMLQSRLKSLDTQTFYLRKLQSLHSILNVPMATNNGNLGDAETGKAFLTGQGFTSASVVAEGEEQSFRMCDRNSLKTILKICRLSENSGIKNLKVKDIDIKFSRDMSDNILTKTQALMNMMNAKIPPEVRNSVVGLFSDPIAVTKLQEKYEEEIQNTQKELDSLQNNQQQNNDNKSAKQLDNQGQ